MARPNSWGSRDNRDRRRTVAQQNAEHPQEMCVECGAKHRVGRHNPNRYQGDNTPIDLTRKAVNA